MGQGRASESDGVWEKLNAYVDGELSAKERAAVAEEVAADPDLARGVAVLQALKAELAEFPGAEDGPRRHRGGWLGPLVPWLSAACLVVALSLGAVWAAGFGTTLAPSDPFLARHLAWAEDPAGTSEAALSEAGVAQAFFAPQLPSLEPFGLALDSLAVVSLDHGGEALHAGYLGRRGCRVSLFVMSRAPGAAAALPEGVLHAAGAAGRWHYRLLAQDMDPARFALVAQALAEQLRRLAPLSEDSRLAYGADPAARAPCMTS